MTTKAFQPNFDRLREEAKGAKERDKQREDNKGDLKFMNFKKGVSRFIVAPPYNQQGDLFKKVFTHWVSKTEKAVCPTATYPGSKLECPVCRALKTLEKNGIQFDDFKAFQARVAIYFNVLPLTINDENVDFEKEGEYVPHILQTSSRVFDFVLQSLEKYKWSKLKPGDDITYDNEIVICVKRVDQTGKKGKFTNYECTLEPDRVEMTSSEEEFAKVLTQITNLDNVWKNTWDLEAWEKSVTLANGLLNKFDFESVSKEMWARWCPQPEASSGSEGDDKKKRKVVVDDEPKKSARKVVETPSDDDSDVISNPKAKTAVVDDDDPVPVRSKGPQPKKV